MSTGPLGLQMILVMIGVAASCRRMKEKSLSGQVVVEHREEGG